MLRKKIEIDLPWSENPITEEEQKEIDEYENTHTYHPEFYADHERDGEDEKHY